MVKIEEWVLISRNKAVYNEKDGRYSFKKKSSAVDMLRRENNTIFSHKNYPGQYSLEVREFVGDSVSFTKYTLTKVTDNNLNRIVSILDVDN